LKREAAQERLRQAVALEIQKEIGAWQSNSIVVIWLTKERESGETSNGMPVRSLKRPVILNKVAVRFQVSSTPTLDSGLVSGSM
jgi:hypothetical protein